MTFQGALIVGGLYVLHLNLRTKTDKMSEIYSIEPLRPHSLSYYVILNCFAAYWVFFVMGKVLNQDGSRAFVTPKQYILVSKTHLVKRVLKTDHCSWSFGNQRRESAFYLDIFPCPISVSL